MLTLFWAEIFTFIIALAWLRLMDFVAQRGWMEKRLSRKIIHVGTGPFFVLCWLLFPEQSISRYLAALVPLLFTLQFALIGLGRIKDHATVDAICRTGNPREMLKGPLFYGIAFVVLTIIYWKDSPIGIIALMLICGGDGLADIFGSKFSSRPIPWSRQKTVLGTLAMFFGGWLFSYLVLLAFIQAGVFEFQSPEIIIPLTILAVIGTIVESLPFEDIDNLTIPAATMIAGFFLFQVI
jgi:phytol kinase